MLGVALLRKQAHRTQHLKGIGFQASKLWGIKRPNEQGRVRRAEAGALALLNKARAEKVRRSSATPCKKARQNIIIPEGGERKIQGIKST